MASDFGERAERSPIGPARYVELVMVASVLRACAAFLGWCLSRGAQSPAAHTLARQAFLFTSNTASFRMRLSPRSRELIRRVKNALLCLAAEGELR